uniref:Uncharacterized protein n=1 Tax=Setaria italica TaxID=4555 RepID=K3YDK2_SETIT
MAFGGITAVFWLLVLTQVYGGASLSSGTADGMERWGYVEVRPKAHIFWWYIQSLQRVSSPMKPWPTILWLQGGPGIPKIPHAAPGLQAAGPNLQRKWLQPLYHVPRHGGALGRLHLCARPLLGKLLPLRVPTVEPHHHLVVEGDEVAALAARARARLDGELLLGRPRPAAPAWDSLARGPHAIESGQGSSSPPGCYTCTGSEVEVWGMEWREVDGERGSGVSADGARVPDVPTGDKGWRLVMEAVVASKAVPRTAAIKEGMALYMPPPMLCGARQGAACAVLPLHGSSNGYIKGHRLANATARRSRRVGRVVGRGGPGSGVLTSREGLAAGLATGRGGASGGALTGQEEPAVGRVAGRGGAGSGALTSREGSAAGLVGGRGGAGSSALTGREGSAAGLAAGRIGAGSGALTHREGSAAGLAAGRVGAGGGALTGREELMVGSRGAGGGARRGQRRRANQPDSAEDE